VGPTHYIQYRQIQELHLGREGRLSTVGTSRVEVPICRGVGCQKGMCPPPVQISNILILKWCIFVEFCLSL